MIEMWKKLPEEAQFAAIAIAFFCFALACVGLTILGLSLLFKAAGIS